MPAMLPQHLLHLCSNLLQDILKFDAPADGLVSQFFRQHKALGPRERHAVAETVYAVLRRRLWWQHLASSGEGPLPRRLVLLAWQGQPQVLEAGCSDTEKRWLQTCRGVDPAAASDKLRHNLPDWLAHALRAQMDAAEFDALAQALCEPAPLDLRVNVLHTKREEAQRALADAGIAAEPTAYSPWGLRVQGKPALTRLELFQRGDIEVQDEGSQLLAWLTGARRGEMVVDFCAGAGGKTLALGAMMRNTGRLYALDVSGHRLEALKPRLARSGLSNVYPLQIAHERDERIKRLYGKIDRVLVDAPCSGLGTLRRNPDLKWRLGRAAVDELRAKQRDILHGAAQLLKPGGRLVYATCSLLRQENEEVAEWFDAEHPQMQALTVQEACKELAAALTPPAPDPRYLRLWPHLHHTDGFFAAVWQRAH